MNSRSILTATLLAIAFSELTSPAEINLQAPPVNAVTNAPRLSNLLQAPNGRPIVTKRDWQKERERISKDWTDFMGEFPKERVPLNAEFLQRENFDTFYRQYVRYQIEEGVATDGYLLIPKEPQNKRPAVVVFHPTSSNQARGVAGLEPTYPEEKRQGVQLVQRGYVVWCPRNFIFAEGAGEQSGQKMWTKNAEKMREKHPTWTAMARMTFDAIRAADFLQSLPSVDKERIGCIGHSLGGKVALFAAAFDERYKVSVSSEGGIGLRFSNWDAPWYFGPAIKEAAFPLENHQVLALVAPRAFLLLAGESADTDRSWSFIQSASTVYRLYGRGENIGWLNHREGHVYSTKAREAAETFLDKHLKK